MGARANLEGRVMEGEIFQGFKLGFAPGINDTELVCTRQPPRVTSLGCENGSLFNLFQGEFTFQQCQIFRM
jgi:hypothetical protein